MNNVQNDLEELRMICERLQDILQQAKLHNTREKVQEFVDGQFIDWMLEYEIKDSREGMFSIDSLVNRICDTFFQIIPQIILQNKHIYTIGHSKTNEGEKVNFWYILHENTLKDEVDVTRFSFDGLNLSMFEELSHDSARLNETINTENLEKFTTTCHKIYNLTINYLNKINKRNPLGFDYRELEYGLLYFYIYNFQCIHHIEVDLPVDAQFITFVGDNGDGKTSILQALGLGLYNSDALTDEERGKNIAIQVQYKEHENSWHNDIYTDWTKPVLSSLRSKMHEVKPFACYGASRLLESDKTDLQNPLLNLYPEKAKLANIFSEWLPRLSVNKPAQFEQVKALLIKLLPNVSDIVKQNENEIISDFLFVEKGKKVEFKHLSAGHKSIVLMIGDMLMRLAKAQPEIENPREFAGIVLIDELESHLHPRWQKEFPRILSETFPNVQFIVTTHSAITLLGMPRNTVFFKVWRTEEEGTQIERVNLDIENLLPNAIYTSPLFDMDSIRSVTNQHIENVQLGEYKEIKQREEVRSEIAKILEQKFNKKV